MSRDSVSLGGELLSLPPVKFVWLSRSLCVIPDAGPTQPLVQSSRDFFNVLMFGGWGEMAGREKRDKCLLKGT